MKKLMAAVLACMCVFSLSFSAFAAVSPVAPTIVTPSESPATTKKPATTKPSGGSDSKPTTTKKTDVDKTKAPGSSTTKRPVTSDKAPVSPDTGSYVSKTVSAAALVAIALSGAVIYTTKKKAE